MFVWMHNRKMLRDRISGIIKEQCLLLGFLVVFCILWLTEVVTRLVLYHNESVYGLWVIYAISTPLSGVIIPIGFIAYLPCKLYYKNHKGKELNGPAEERVPVPDAASVATTTKRFMTTSDGGNNEAKQEKCVIASNDGQHSERQTKESMEVQLSETEPLLGQRDGPPLQTMQSKGFDTSVYEPLNASSAVWHFECSQVIEIHDGITFNFCICIHGLYHHEHKI